MSNIIYGDESGYTGGNFLDGNQPVYVIATHNLDLNIAKELAQKHFHGVQGDELKYKNLKKNKEQYIANFIIDIAKFKEKIKVSVTHKYFCAICTFIEFAIEPVFHEIMKESLYKNGANLGLANLTYVHLHSFLTHDQLKSFINTVFKFLTFPDKRTYNDLDALFIKLISDKANSEAAALGKALEILYFPFRMCRLDNMRGLTQQSYDVTFSAILDLCSKWKNDLSDDYEFIFDKNSHLKKKEREWNALVRYDEKVRLGYDRRTITFPIGIKQTSFLDSKESIGIQIADVLAGAFSEYYTSIAFKYFKEKEDYSIPKPMSKKIAESIEQNLAASFIMWPGHEVTPEELGCTDNFENDHLDGIANILTKS